MKKIEKILFPTKFRELSFNALESLLVLKEDGLREVLLLYIIPRDEVAFVPYGGYLKEVEEKLREEARIRFEDWQRVLTQAGVESRIVIEVGDPVPRILSIADNEKVDLIVAGKKRKTGAEGIFIGSRTMGILRRTRVPVLVHKYMVQFKQEGETVTRTNDRIFERPLLATDWSPPSERSLELLLPLRKVLRRAIVTHIISSTITSGMDTSGLRRLEEESRTKLERYCKTLEDAGIEAEYHLSAGDEVREIIQVSRDFTTTMIIMGSTGKGRLHKLVLGSVSHGVAEASELPTLLVP